MIFNVIFYIKILILKILAIYNQDHKMIFLIVLMTSVLFYINEHFYIKILYFLYNIDSEKQKN